MKLLLLIISIIILVVAAILCFALTITLKHTVEEIGLGLIGMAVFASSFLPIRA